MKSTSATLIIHNQDEAGQATTPRHKSKLTSSIVEPDNHAPPGSFRAADSANFRHSKKGFKTSSKGKKSKGHRDPVDGIELIDPVSYISQTSSSNLAQDDNEHDSRSSTYSHQRIDHARQTERASHSPLLIDHENSNKENSRKSHKRISSRKKGNEDASNHVTESTKDDHAATSTKNTLEKLPELEDM
jgi:hypothetical protein